MSELKALDELRGWIVATVDYGLGPDGTNLERLRDIADAIKAEIAERYMELPVDADGVVIRIGDEMEAVGSVHTVIGLAPGYYITGERKGSSLLRRDGWELAKRGHHVKLRTIEDVLHEYAKRVLNSGHQWGLDAEETTANYAAELRELMGGGE